MFIILLVIFMRVPEPAFDILVLDAGGLVGGVFVGGEGLVFVTRREEGGLVSVSCRWDLWGCVEGGEKG